MIPMMIRGTLRQLLPMFQYCPRQHLVAPAQNLGAKREAMMILFQNARGLQRAHRTCQCCILIVMPMFSPTLMDMHIFGFLIGIHVFTFWRDHRIHQLINEARREPYDGKVIILVQSKDIMCMRILRIVQHGI